DTVEQAVFAEPFRHQVLIVHGMFQTTDPRSVSPPDPPLRPPGDVLGTCDELAQHLGRVCVLLCVCGQVPGQFVHPFLPASGPAGEDDAAYLPADLGGGRGGPRDPGGPHPPTPPPPAPPDRARGAPPP